MPESLTPDGIAILPPKVRAVIAALTESNTALTESNAALAEANAELDANNKRLDYLVKEFRLAIYGKRSEALDPGRLDLLREDMESAIAETEAKGEASEAVKRARGSSAPARRNIGRLPEELPRIETVIEPESTFCPCGCGEMKKIGEDRIGRLYNITATFRASATVRPKYACAVCAKGVLRAPAPAHLIEGGLPTEALIAHVLVSKYADHMPMYRQAQAFARQGLDLDLDRGTLASWAGVAGFHLAPVVDLLASTLLRSGRLFMDEARCPVIDPGRGSKHTESFLGRFEGNLQVDGYAGYNRLTRSGHNGGPVIQLAYCCAHGKIRAACESLRRMADGKAVSRLGQIPTR